jgi:hypothetical protein
VMQAGGAPRLRVPSAARTHGRRCRRRSALTPRPAERPAPRRPPRTPARPARRWGEREGVRGGGVLDRRQLLAGSCLPTWSRPPWSADARSCSPRNMGGGASGRRERGRAGRETCGGRKAGRLGGGSCGV